MSTDTLAFKSGYMNRVYDVRDIAKTFRLLKKHHPDKLQFDTLVGMGLSGSIVVPQLAQILRKKWLVIRKDKDGTHSMYGAEGELGRRWLFVDDLIASGNTRRKCVERVRQLTRDHGGYVDDWSQLVGSFLYDNATLETNTAAKKLNTWDSVPVYRVNTSRATHEFDVAGPNCDHCNMYQYRCKCDEFVPYIPSWKRDQLTSIAA